MLGVLLSVALLAGALAAGAVLTAAGLRNGDRDDDAHVAATAHPEPPPAGGFATIAVTVHNPAHVPILVGLSARRGSWLQRLRGPVTIHVPRRPTRLERHAPNHTLVGIVDTATSAYWHVPLPTRTHYAELTATIGQDHHRLRRITRTITPRSPPGPPEPHLATLPEPTR